jgi:hypothetical protein
MPFMNEQETWEWINRLAFAYKPPEGRDFHCGIDCVEKCEGCSHELKCYSWGTSEKCAGCEWEEDCLSCNEEEVPG